MRLSNIVNIKKNAHKAFIEEYDNYPWEIIDDLEKYLLKLKDKKGYEQNYKENIIGNIEDVYIGSGTFVEKGAYIIGPAFIGDNCIIKSGAYIARNVLIGDNCKVGHASEINNSFICDNSNIAHFNHVSDSIIGNNVNLGAGVKCSNCKNIPYKGIVNVLWNDEKVSTNRFLFGSIIGDNCKIGCNSVLNPGSILETDVYTYPLVTIRGYIEKNVIIKSNTEVVPLNEL